MNRREAVRRTFLFGSAIAGTNLAILNQGCSTVRDGDDTSFTDDQEKAVAEFADILIPDSKYPGAKSAGVGPFIVMMINDCYPKDVQREFLGGLTRVEAISQTMFRKPFGVIARPERERVVKTLKDEAESEKGASLHFFKLINELAFLGYFTSEVGVTQALDYVPVPGRYDGCIPLADNQRAWAI